ncbi:TetR/AcrR family transcriptional regulator [Nocardioides aequoreus]|uniref:TetR/AcrR family transcriptional regulator n=1 Tax=Nocardioides aequoreus TaxID=397278 RepID=UPI00068B7C38|nr:TetR/AcrR family transcriptional regulator [Nocardioides aequoreus]
MTSTRDEVLAATEVAYPDPASTAGGPRPTVPRTVAPAVVPDATAPVRRKRGRPRDPLADGRILAAASSLILLRGFDAMTVDEVAATAGVGKATVYRRWAKKEDLAVAAMERLYSDEMPVPDTGTLRGDLAEAYRAQLGFAQSPAGADYLRTLVKESMRDDRMASLYRAAHEQSERNAREIFRRAKERGEIDVEVPVSLLVKLVSGLVVLATVMGNDSPTSEDLEALVDLVVRGISA